MLLGTDKHLNNISLSPVKISSPYTHHIPSDATDQIGPPSPPPPSSRTPPPPPPVAPLFKKDKHLLVALPIHPYPAHFSPTNNAQLSYVILYKSGQGRLIFKISRPHTDTRNRQDSSERVISSSQRPLPIQHTTNTGTNIHALSWIRTSNLSNQVPAELCLRPHGHWRRPPSASNSHKLTAKCPLTGHCQVTQGSTPNTIHTMKTALGTLPGIAWCIQVRSNDMYYDSNYWLGKVT